MPTTLTFLPNFTFTKTMTSSSSLESFMTIDNQSKNKAHKIIWTWTEFTICFDDRESKEKLHIWKMPQILKCFYLAQWFKSVEMSHDPKLWAKRVILQYDHDHFWQVIVNEFDFEKWDIFDNFHPLWNFIIHHHF